MIFRQLWWDPATAMTRSHSSSDNFELTRATTRVSDRRSASADASRAASELNVGIEVWVNEGGAGGEPNESTSRPRRG
jgi:hypothetical protein